MAVTVLGAVLCVSASSWQAHAGDEGEVRPLPTITILEELAGEAGRELTPALPGDTTSTVVLAVEPAENTWFVEAGFMKGLAPRTVLREPGRQAATSVSVGIKSMGVAYENVRRDGLFGSRVVTRTAFLEADVVVSDRASGEIVHRAAVLRTRRDDVPVDDISRLEEPGLTWTTGTVPPEGFFSSILEPLITVGAIAVAVILLFTVRS